MMFKINKLQVIIVAVLLVLFSVVKVKADTNNIIILYDTYNEFASDENKLNSLIQAVLGTGEGVDIVNIKSYSKNMLDKYKYALVLCNNSSQIPSSIINDLLSFRGNIMWIGKSFNDSLRTLQNLQYVPNFSSAGISYADFRKKIYIFIKGNQWKENNVYILIDKVYPFINLSDFVKKIDFLYDQGIPFICSVMPVYENYNFDAMKNFCEVLRYAQDRGGKIILHSSVLYGDNIPGEDVKAKMDLAQKVYVNYGVYPAALDIPEGFLYKEDYKDLIYSSNNIFMEKDKNIGILDFKKYSMAPLYRIINKVDISSNYLYKDPKNVHNIAFVISSDLSLDDFKEKIKYMLDKGFYFSDAAYLDSTIKLGGVELKYVGSDVLLNDKPIQNSVYKNTNKAESKTVDISKLYSHIIQITVVVCIIFIVIVLMAIRIDIRKFFK